LFSVETSGKESIAVIEYLLQPFGIGIYKHMTRNPGISMAVKSPSQNVSFLIMKGIPTLFMY
jgi:hypothetical protein